MKGDLKSLVARGVNLAGDKGERSVRVLIDTGASRSMVRGDLAALLGTPAKLPRPITLTLGDDSTISIVDAVQLAVEIGGKKLSDSFLVFDSLIEEAVLGVETMRKYGLKIDLESQAIYAEMREDTTMKDFLKKMLAAIGITSVKDDLTEDEAIELVKSKTAGNPALPESLLVLLDLDKNATEPQVRGAIMALKSPAGVVPLAEHEALKTKLAVLEIDAAVMAALSDGKLSPAEKDGWLKDLKDGTEKLETFAAFTARRGKVVPLREKLPDKNDDAGAAAIGEAELAVMRQMGVSQETFLKHNTAR